MRATEKNITFNTISCKCRVLFSVWLLVVASAFNGPLCWRYIVVEAIMMNFSTLDSISSFTLPPISFDVNRSCFCHSISLFCNNTLCSVCCRCAIPCSTTFLVGMLSIWFLFVCMCVLCCPITEAFGSSHTVLLSIALSVGCCFAVEHVK